MSNTLVETVRLPGNLCPEHLGSDFHLSGNPEMIGTDGRTFLVVPKVPDEAWKMTHFDQCVDVKGILLHCVKCNNVTFHVWQEGGFEWNTVAPRDWRNQVRFEWDENLNPTRRTLWNVLAVRFSKKKFEKRIALPILPEQKNQGLIPRPALFGWPTTIFSALWRDYSCAHSADEFKECFISLAARIEHACSGYSQILSQLFYNSCRVRQEIYDARHRCSSPELERARKRFENDLVKIGFHLPPLREEPPPKNEKLKLNELGNEPGDVGKDSEFQQAMDSLQLDSPVELSPDEDHPCSA